MKRTQRSRLKGSSTPPNTIYVGRPTKWGNPYVVRKTPRQEMTRSDQWRVYKVTDEKENCVSRRSGRLFSSKQAAAEYAVNMCQTYLLFIQAKDPKAFEVKYLSLLRQAENLSCWCGANQHCHADVWIDLLKQPPAD